MCIRDRYGLARVPPLYSPSTAPWHWPVSYTHLDVYKRQVFCADLIPGRPWVHVPITMGYDRCAETVSDEKRAFLQDMLARNVQLFFTHDAGCAMAQVVCDDKGRFAAAHEKAQLLGWELDD